ncbi:MAG: hypothetical protein J6B98_03475, partial [Bacilli bacterium]|nr:hypothetical protein [Bacilli bacterium]
MSLWNMVPLKPMLLKEVNKPFNDKDYIFEIKFDGIRAIIYANKKSVKIYSRNGKDITHLYPELQTIKKVVTKNTIFDGEIVLFDNNVPSFEKLLRRNNVKSLSKIEYYQESNPVTYMCFDILYEGKDLTNLTLMERKMGISNDIYDIAVIGAGPAGAVFVKEIAASRPELKILLVDGQAQNTAKPCGGLLAPDAQKLLARFDLALPKS